MARTKRLIRSFYRLLLPTAILILLAFVGSSLWLLHNAANPPKAAYLVTPEKYGRLSARGAQVTNETWSNRDGTQARGWLLRGAENAPAIVLLHRYGADRSWVLDLGVKLNEATDFTVLMPDARGHGETPLVGYSTFGAAETEDVLAAADFLRSLKNEARTGNLVDGNLGLFGVELGGISGLSAAAKDENFKALALDSVPLSSNELLASVIGKRFPFASSITSKIAAGGTHLYYYNGGYSRESACDAAKSIADRRILLLAGADAPAYQDSTRALQNCLPNSVEIESKMDLSPSGYNIGSASLEQAAAYDQRVIDFFKRSLNNE